MKYSHQPSPHDTVLEQWNRALQTYRASVDLYSRVLQIRHRRQIRVPLGLTSSAPRDALAASRVPLLDDLTPREREVALLIARGFSNRQIAAELVITQGTAANHVAHIINKLGVANRARVAAAVAAADLVDS